jgi:hypothetical protein
LIQCKRISSKINLEIIQTLYIPIKHFHHSMIVPKVLSLFKRYQMQYDTKHEAFIWMYVNFQSCPSTSLENFSGYLLSLDYNFLIYKKII